MRILIDIPVHARGDGNLGQMPLVRDLHARRTFVDCGCLGLNGVGGVGRVDIRTSLTLLRRGSEPTTFQVCPKVERPYNLNLWSQRVSSVPSVSGTPVGNGRAAVDNERTSGTSSELKNSSAIGPMFWT